MVGFFVQFDKSKDQIIGKCSMYERNGIAGNLESVVKRNLRNKRFKKK